MEMQAGAKSDSPENMKLRPQLLQQKMRKRTVI